MTTDSTGTFNTPDAEEVLQEDAATIEAVPVTVDGVVRVDEMPTQLGSSRAIKFPAGTARAEKVLSADPRRKRMVMWGFFTLDADPVCFSISNTESEANDLTGAFVVSPGSNGIMRYEFTFTDEVWARPFIVNDTAGIITSLGIPADDSFLCIVTEQWSR